MNFDRILALAAAYLSMAEFTWWTFDVTIDRHALAAIWFMALSAVMYLRIANSKAGRS